MRTMREIADRVLVIFEFEKAIYERANVPVDWVGHPLLDVMPPSEPRGTFVRSVGLAPERPVVALLPGSRRNELREILPRLVDAANRILQVVLTFSSSSRARHLQAICSRHSSPLVGAEGHRRGQTDRVLAEADVAIVASGTVTVQAALHGCPWSSCIGCGDLRAGPTLRLVDTFAMANLVAGRRVVRNSSG
jgi:lipid-A-disaccharide synthase